MTGSREERQVAGDDGPGGGTHASNWRPHGDDAAGVARPQGEGTRGRDDDVGALLGMRTAVAVLQAEGGAGNALGEGRPGRRRRRGERRRLSGFATIREHH